MSPLPYSSPAPSPGQSGPHRYGDPERSVSVGLCLLVLFHSFTVNGTPEILPSSAVLTMSRLTILWFLNVTLAVCAVAVTFGVVTSSTCPFGTFSTKANVSPAGSFISFLPCKLLDRSEGTDAFLSFSRSARALPPKNSEVEVFKSLRDFLRKPAHT